MIMETGDGAAIMQPQQDFRLRSFASMGTGRVVRRTDLPHTYLEGPLQAAKNTVSCADSAKFAACVWMII